MNGIYRLNSTTVFADPDADTLTGGSSAGDRDWFWVGAGDSTDANLLLEQVN
jgi:hypothetical protein